MYLASVGVLLLLLLAWHFSIQASAHHTAREQVNVWLKSMGASAEDVQFRMLRGALTIESIKTSYQGNPIFIQRLFLKGNPASISSEKPLLHQVVIQQATLDAKAATDQWQDLNISFPPSLLKIIRHAKHIALENIIIRHAGKLKDINIESIFVSGAGDQRKLSGQGFIGETNDSFELHGVLPADQSKQFGEISSSYQNIQSIISWSGSWQAQNFQSNIQQSDFKKDATLQLQLNQDKTQWKTSFQANRWRIDTDKFHTTLTGKGRLEGTPTQWVLESPRLTLNKSTFLHSELKIEHTVTTRVHLDSTTKDLHIENLDIRDSHIVIDTSRPLPAQNSWQWDIKNIDIHNLEPELVTRQNSFFLPPLNGEATVSSSILQLDLSSQTDSEQFWRVKSTDGNSFQINASAVPLLQLRNFLPGSIRESALTLEGSSSLKVNTQPFNQWLTSGKVDVADMLLTSKNKVFTAKKLVLNVQHADVTGVQEASLVANQWLMQFPLTPRQAWAGKSHLDEWAKIPWSFQRIQFNQGQIAVGNISQTWLHEAHLDIKHWQQSPSTTLKLTGTFGSSPFKTDMTLKMTPEHGMSWESININFKHAHLFALSDWLDISGIPRVEQGHLSLQLKAKRNNQHIKGNSHITLDQFKPFTKQHQDDYLLQYTGQTTQSLTKQLTYKNKIDLTTAFTGDVNHDWSSLASSSFMKTIQEKLSQTQTRGSSTKKTSQTLGSLSIHQDRGLSQNERTRLRKIIFKAKHKRRWHIELTPDLGTAPLTSKLNAQVFHTQSLIKSFMSKRGIKAQNIYHIFPQEKHKSTSSAGAIHINLVK
ncbi:MAG: hypothetical protein R8M46_01735 [Ghiorsea sp.]